MWPDRPLKFYLSLSGLARATFFKAKSDLIELGAISRNSDGFIRLEKEVARRLILERYPGIVHIITEGTRGDGPISRLED